MILKLRSLFIMFLVFLPFTKALTLNLGFPLKISELIMGLLIIILAIKSLLRPSSKLGPFASMDMALILFLIWVTGSFLVNLFWSYDYELKTIPSRIGSLKLDSLLRLIYIYICASAYFISKSFFHKDSQILSFWLVGAIIASIYSWYLFLSSSFGLPYIKLIGMDEIPQNIRGVIRCGTFKEGNFFGLYLILSAVISFYLKKRKTGIFLMLTTITTLSTITFISVFVFLAYLIGKSFLTKKKLKYVLISLPFIAVFTILFVQSSFYEDRIHAKLNQHPSELSRSNFSKVDRVLSSRIAFKQGLNNPVFGVGPYNYGLHYDRYNDFETYIKNNNEWSLQFFKRHDKRAIPNNVYLEIWSEYGILGFLLFLFFLLLILNKAFKSKNNIISGGVIALMLSFNAFPSFIMLFIWVFLALPSSLIKTNVR